MASAAPAIAHDPPEIRESSSFYEVVGTAIVEQPPIGAYEYELASILQDVLSGYVRENALGRVVTETLFNLRPDVDRDRRPDVAFISAERWPLGTRAPKGVDAWPVIPDLAVEIVSPSNTSSGVLTKIEEYFAAGVKRVWVLHSDQSKVYDYQSPTTLRVLAAGDELDCADLFPGFRVSLRRLFEE